MRAGPGRVVLKQGGGLHLVCLPFAGGSARSFVRLARHVPQDWQVTAVQPPAGFAGGLDELATCYLGLLAGELRGPGLLLGHSLGAAVAHRMARKNSAGLPGNLHVVLSAPPEPGVCAGGLLDLDDRALLQEATRRGMLPVLRTPEDFALRFLLPDLRTDLAVLGRSGWTPEPLDVPVHLLGGRQDPASPTAVLVSLVDSLGPRSAQLVEGGHMYVLEQPAETVRALLAISRTMAGPVVTAASRSPARAGIGPRPRGS